MTIARYTPLLVNWDDGGMVSLRTRAGAGSAIACRSWPLLFPVGPWFSGAVALADVPVWGLHERPPEGVFAPPSILSCTAPMCLGLCFHVPHCTRQILDEDV